MVSSYNKSPKVIITFADDTGALVVKSATIPTVTIVLTPTPTPTVPSAPTNPIAILL